jgi:tetratricopeptide (TPR) repeat protein
VAPTPAPVAPPSPPPAAEALTPEASAPARPAAAEPVAPGPKADRPAAAPTAEPKAPAKTPKQLVEAGWDALEDSDTERAITLGRAALKAGGGGPAHFLLGKALLAAGLRREALAQFQKAAAANPKDKEAASMAENVRRLLEENP